MSEVSFLSKAGQLILGKKICVSQVHLKTAVIKI